MKSSPLSWLRSRSQSCDPGEFNDDTGEPGGDTGDSQAGTSPLCVGVGYGWTDASLSVVRPVANANSSIPLCGFWPFDMTTSSGVKGDIKGQDGSRNESFNRSPSNHASEPGKYDVSRISALSELKSAEIGRHWKYACSDVAATPRAKSAALRTLNVPN